MNAADLPPELAQPATPGLMDAVRSIAQGSLAGRAYAIDRGAYPVDLLKQLAAAEEWPNVAAFIRNLPPRLIPRKALAAPPPDREAGRQKSAELKSNLNRVLQQKGS